MSRTSVFRCHVCGESKLHSSNRSTTCIDCITAGYKWCNVCHRVKSTAEFGKKGTRLNGACRACENVRSKVSKAATGYYKRPEVISHRNEYKNTLNRTRYATDPDFRAKEIARCHDRRSITKGTLTPKQWHEACAAFNLRCAYCGTETNLTMDHVVPVTKYGETCASNIVPACKQCNSSKSNKDVVEWYTTQPFYSKERLENVLKYIKLKEMEE